MKDPYEHIHMADSIYTMEEIFSRIYCRLNQMHPLCGYTYTLRVEADNATEPPYIKLVIMEDITTIFDLVVDQNTHVDELNYWLNALSECVVAINRAYKECVTFNEALELIAKEKEEQNKNLPF